jgi:hypothetical protein
MLSTRVHSVLTSLSQGVVCHRALRVSEICPERCCASYTVRKRERAGPTENLPPPALYAARDRKLIRMLTGAALHCGPQPGGDFSPSRVVCIHSKTKWKGGGPQYGSTARLLTKKRQMDVKTSFFDVMSEVQKDLQEVSAGRGQFKKNPTYV